MFVQLDLSYFHKSIAPSSTRFHSTNIQSLPIIQICGGQQRDVGHSPPL